MGICKPDFGRVGFDVNKVGDARVGLVGKLAYYLHFYITDKLNMTKELRGTLCRLSFSWKVNPAQQAYRHFFRGGLT